MADMIKFYKGALANLPASGANGALYITTDEGAIYLGTGVGMKRLGDFVQVDAVANLPTAGANTSALYYCVAENVLAKWSGTEWKQVNKQPTKDELKVLLGLDTEGVVTKAIAAAKKAGDDAGVAAANAQKDVDALEAYVGTIPNGYTEETVIAYINKKAEETLNAASGGSSESAASVKAALDTEIARAKAAEEANAKAAAAAQTAADNAQTTADGKTTMAEVEAKGYATKEDAKGYADAKDDDIAAAQKAGDDAQADVDALELKVGTVAEGKTVVGLISDAQTAADNAQDAVDTLAGKVGTVPSDKTVVQMIADAQAAATYDDEEVRGLISDNAADIKAIADDYLKAADKTELQGNIDTVSGKVTTLVGEDANKSVRTIANEELAKQLIAEGAAESLDTLQEIAAWIQSHPDDASAMNDAIVALQKQLQGIDAGDGTVKKYVDDAIAALNVGQYALAADLTALAGRVSALETASAKHATKDELKAVQDQINALGDTYATDKELTDAIAGEVERANGAYAAKTLESTVDTHVADKVVHITADERTAWNAAEQNAKDHADGLDSAMDTRVKVLEAIDHEAYKAADAELAAAIEAAKTDASNKDTVVLAEAQKAVAAAKTELQGNIDTVSGALETYKTSNDAEVAKKANSADVYTKTEVEAMLTWGEF